MGSTRMGMASFSCLGIEITTILTGALARHAAKFICYAPPAFQVCSGAMLTLFYILIVEQIVQGLHSLWDGLRWLQSAQRRVEGHAGFYTPRVALFCPVKG